jgi:hypothetical protein
MISCRRWMPVTSRGREVGFGSTLDTDTRVGCCPGMGVVLCAGGEERVKLLSAFNIPWQRNGDKVFLMVPC